MSFNQYRTNPSQAVSNFKGRSETPRAWPSTAVSTWTNGGLFGGAVTPQWELLSSFNPTSYASGFEFDASAYNADWAAIKISWSARSTSATNANYTMLSCARMTGSSKVYSRGSGIRFYTTNPQAITSNQNTFKIVNYESAYNFIQCGEYEWWGLESSTIQNSYGTNSMFGEGYYGNNSSTNYAYISNTTQSGNWDKFRLFLGASGNENTSSRFEGSKSRFMIWGLKAQREVLA